MRTSAIPQSEFEEMEQDWESVADENELRDAFGSIDNYLLTLLNGTLFAKDIDENDPALPTGEKEQLAWIKTFFDNSTLELVGNSSVYRTLEWT